MLGVLCRFYLVAMSASVLAGGLVSPAVAEPVPRSGPAAGAVIARKAGEEVRFIDVSNWRFVDLRQDLLTGDVLRTNATGQLAILFSDRTQIRLGRNSALVVKQVTSGTSADTVLQLQSGTIWARAERGGPGVQVETPAAAAAIRGTDWTMTVSGSQTSLTVLEGVVQFSNPQGSVEVRQGEGAVASIGQAPRKVVIVESDDREQMLFYLPPREAFERMPPSVQPVADMRRHADRITAMPPEQRSTEDWVSLAEAQLSLEGRARTKETLAVLQGRQLSAAQRARVTLIEAILAASETRYADAARLFAKAERGLDSKRRGIALYGGYYARSLADPNRVEPLPPQVGGPDGAFLRAYAVGFLQDLKAAIKVLADAEKQYPDDPELPAYRAWLALLLNDRQQAQDAMKKALAIDPQEPTALEVRSHYKAGIEGDIDGALADAEAAVRVTPGSSSTWNEIGNLQSERSAGREAEAAYRKAIELDPEDPVARANLAFFYLDLNRVEDAKREIDLALERDPTLSVALIARGRYFMQTGDMDRALEDLLAGTVSDPAYAEGQALLAAALYQKGDRVAAEQAADNADRLDDNSPGISALRTSVAIDSYDSEGAIRNAQEYVKRARARGGQYSSLGANQQAGSALNYAFRFQGLNAWGEYYSDAVFDPFSGVSYIDQGIRGSANPFANGYLYGADIINNSPNGQGFSSILQGLLLEPTLISSRTRGIDLLPQPFLEASIGGGITSTGGDLGYVAEGEVQGYSNLPFPISFYANLEWQTLPDSRDISGLTDLDIDNKVLGGNVYLTASPTPYDRFVLYFNQAHADFSRDSRTLSVPGLVLVDDIDSTTTITNGGIGWSHTFGYENILNAALLFSEQKRKSELYEEVSSVAGAVGWLTENELRQQTYIAAINHSIGMDNFTLRYGIEGGWIDTYQSQNLSFVVPVPFPITSAEDFDKNGVGRIYADLLHDITADLKAEYALFGSLISDDTADTVRLDPRVGIAWSPFEGQWLRAGFIRNSVDLSTPTLSPVGIVGLQQNEISFDPGGSLDTYAFRWDAEWTTDFFTALEYQHQDVHDASIILPLQADTFDTGRGSIDRTSLTANLLLGHGFGLSSTVAYSDTDDKSSAPTAGGQLPFVPEWAGQVALTWVNEANVKATIAANYIGERVDEDGLDLGDYWTLDASLTWEPFDKRFELELAAYNVLDEDFTLDHDDFGNPITGWGRSFKGSLKVRF